MLNKKITLIIIVATIFFCLTAVSANQTVEDNVDNNIQIQNNHYTNDDTNDIVAVEKNTDNKTSTKTASATNTTRSDIKITANNITSYSGKNITYKAKVTTDNNTKVSISTAVLKINGKSITKSNITNGTVSFNFIIPTLKEGNHTITITTGQTNSYTAATVNNTLSIYKQNVTITLTNKTSYAGKNISITARVKANNAYINISKCVLKLSGTTIATSKVINGTANFTFTTPNVKAGTYPLYMITQETTLYNSANITRTITINRQNLTVSASNITSYAGKNITYNVNFKSKTSNNATNIPAVLKINDITVAKANITNSKAIFTFTTPNLSAKTYDILVKIGDSKFFNAANITRTLTIVR